MVELFICSRSVVCILSTMASGTSPHTDQMTTSKQIHIGYPVYTGDHDLRNQFLYELDGYR